MADEVLLRDQNHITVLGAITNDSDEDIMMLRVDPITKRLLISADLSTTAVTSLNGLTGAVILAAGTNITLTPVGNTITISATDTDTGITQLTGDITAGPGSGSQVAILATVNSNVGSFGSATQVCTFTVNGKGLITAASNIAIQIAESQVTNLTTDLGNKQPLATNLTSLSGLSYVSLSFVKMSANGTFSLDTNTYLTSNQTITLSGEASGSGATSISVTLSNSAVIGKVLTGYISGAGTVSATDTILQAIQKLNGNTAALVTGVSSVNSLTGAVALTGTANRLTISAANVFDISSSYVGQASITTVGTITTGTWSGLFGAVTGANLTNLTAGNLTGTIPSAVLGNSSLFIGTTSIALNRATASQALTGITSIDGSAATLTTPRTIGGVSFNGSANITVATATGGFTISGGNLAIDARNISTDTTTGTKFGIATNQKIAFYNSTPIVQPTGDVITGLQNLGLMASATIAATTITSRTLWGQTYDGSANVTGSLTSVGDITGGASSMIITAGTGNSRTLTLRTTTSGGTATNALYIDAAQKVGIGTTSPVVLFDVRGTNAHLNVGTDTTDFLGGSQTGIGVSNSTEKIFYAVQTGLCFFGAISDTTIAFVVNNNSRMYLTKTNFNLKLNGTAVRGTTEGFGTLDIFDLGGPPAGTLASGASFFCQSGEMKVIDSAGNITQISPHDKQGNWIYDSVDSTTGRHLRIDMEKMLKFLEKKFGTNFIKEFYEPI